MTEGQFLPRGVVGRDPQPMVLGRRAGPLPALDRSPAPAAGAGQTAAAVSDTGAFAAPAADLDLVRSQAFEAGVREGLARAQAASARASAEQQAAMKTLVASLDHAVAGHAQALEALVADLVIAAVCRMLGVVYADRQAAVASVRQTLLAAGLDGPAQVQVHPSEARWLLQALGNPPDGARHAIEVVAGADVSLGGCRIQLADGTLDARLDVQLELLRDSLQQARSAWLPP